MSKNLIPQKVITSEDFRPAAIQKALFQNSLSHWSFRYSFPAILGAGLTGVLFGFSYPIFLSVLGIIGFSSTYFIFNQVIKSDTFKKKYIDQLIKRQEELTKEKLLNLKQELINNKLDDAAQQLGQFEQKFQNLIEILKTKFDKTQLTYGRYYGIAQEVYLSGIDNITDILLAKKTMNSIDLEYVSSRLARLENKDKNNKVVKKEIDALLRSQFSYKMQDEKIGSLIAENETALTQLDEASIAISEIKKSKDKQGQIDMENSMKALAEMASRSKLYSR